MDDSEINALARSMNRRRKGKRSRKFRSRRNAFKNVSVHAFHRYEERVGNSKHLQENVEMALKHGKRWCELKPGILQDYVRGLTHSRRKLILFYRNAIFVFGTAKKGKSRNLVTMWPLPEPLIQEGNEEGEEDDDIP